MEVFCLVKVKEVDFVAITLKVVMMVILLVI